MAFIIAEPCIGTKDTACVDACPVDCIHPKKDTKYDDVVRGSNKLTSSSLTRSSALTAARACQSAQFRRSSRWMTFPRNGTPTLRRTPITSKAASSSRKNTGWLRASTAALPFDPSSCWDGSLHLSALTDARSPYRLCRCSRSSVQGDG